MAAGVAITGMELDAAGLRHAAARSKDADAARRMLALALVMEGRSRAEAATSCGMDRQTLRDWVHRYNELGLAGLSDRVAPGPKPRLSPDEEAEVARLVREGPIFAEHGVVRWRRIDLSRVIKARFVWPGLKKELPAALSRAANAHPDKRIALYFQDEARIGQKGRPCHRWWLRGERPTGPVDQRYTFAYAFAAIEPATGRDFCLVLPTVSTAAMTEFPHRFAITLPPYSPDLNPVERVWLYLRERRLSHRIHNGYRDILDVVCQAWCQLALQRPRALRSHPRTKQINE